MRITPTRSLIQYIPLLALGALLAACTPQLHPFDQVPDQTPRPAAHGGQPDFGTASNTNIPPIDYSTLPPSKVVKVGLLVPLTGNSAKLGKALQDAAVLALFDKYAALSGPQSSIRVELIPKDTKGTPIGAQQAAADAVKEGAQLIIGPLFSSSVEAIKPLAQTGKISILSFSNNAAVAGNGVYTMGFNPDAQAKRVAYYAFQKGVKQMAGLIPSGAYGRQVLGAVKDVSTLFGRNVSPIVHYSPSAHLLTADVKKLVAQGSVGARFTFDALFLPEGGNALGLALKTLAEANIHPASIQFIGTGLWDDRDLIRRHNLEGAWLASSPPHLYNGFEQRFTHNYGYKPPRIASLAYDAIALAATLATSGDGFTRTAIADNNGYSGPANGIFRFRSDGTVERGLAILQVQKGGFQIVDPAPSRFR